MITRVVRQARREFQRSLRGNRKQRAREAGESIEEFLEVDQKQEAWKFILSWYKQASEGSGPTVEGSPGSYRDGKGKYIQVETA